MRGYYCTYIFTNSNAREVDIPVCRKSSLLNSVLLVIPSFLFVCLLLLLLFLLVCLIALFVVVIVCWIWGRGRGGYKISSA